LKLNKTEITTKENP